MFRCLHLPAIGLLLLAVLNVQAAPSIRSISTANILTTQEEGLGNPYFTSFGFPFYENQIILSYFNPNENSETEIYISTSPDEGFVLAEVAAPGETVFYDDTRAPRTTFYFKLRAIRDELVSGFSAVRSFTTGSKFYPPSLTGHATSPGTIELQFSDRSYDDISYSILREGPGPDFHKTITAPDSGQVFTFTDEFLEPNTRYTYRVDAYTKGPNMPRYIGIVNFTVTTPEGPSIFAFTLIDSDMDAEVGTLDDGAVITPPAEMNIVAEASPTTGSVVFFLNGRKRTENEPPYSFFHDANGDYKPGKLEPGDYELLAIPYTGNNAQGIAGASLQINFTVQLPEGSLDIESFTLVDPNTGLDIKQLQDGDMVDPFLQPNIRANTGDQVSSVVFALNGRERTENETPYAYFHDAGGVYRPGQLTETHYVLMATGYSGNNGSGEAGTTRIIEFTVVGSQAAGATSVLLYPNPVVNSSVFEISGAPESSVRVETADPYGFKRALLYEGTLDSEGRLTKSLDVTRFRKGNYIMLIHLNDQVIHKRFMVR